MTRHTTVFVLLMFLGALMMSTASAFGYYRPRYQTLKLYDADVNCMHPPRRSDGRVMTNGAFYMLNARGLPILYPILLPYLGDDCEGEFCRQRYAWYQTAGYYTLVRYDGDLANATDIVCLGTARSVGVMAGSLFGTVNMFGWMKPGGENLALVFSIDVDCDAGVMTRERLGAYLYSCDTLNS